MTKPIVETGWLIQHPTDPKWITVDATGAIDPMTFTPEVALALRFAQQAGAAAHVAAHCQSEPVEIVEHRWIDGAWVGAAPAGA